MRLLQITKIALCFLVITTMNAQEQESINCDLNFKEALFFLKGDENFKKDTAKAIAYLKPCAALGFDDAQLLLGRLYLGEKTEEGNLRAFDLIKKSATQNNPIAIADLGILYKYGYGCELNFNKARRLFKKAAEMGNDKAAYSLGYLYLKGLGNITQDYLKAVEWFKKSNYSMAKYWLGVCYYKGYGVAKNNQKANEYLNTNFSESVEIGYTTTILNENDQNLITDIDLQEEDTSIEENIKDEFLLGKWKGKLLKLDWSSSTIEEKFDVSITFKYDSVNEVTTSEIAFENKKIEDEYLKLNNTVYFNNTSISLPHLSFSEQIPAVLESQLLSIDFTLKIINETNYLIGNIESYISGFNEPGVPLRLVLEKENGFTNSANEMSDEVLKALSAQEENFIKLYPNPFQDDLIISYTLNSSSFVKVLFNDFYGNNAMQIEPGKTQDKGDYTYYYNTTSLQKGTYIVSVITDDKKYTRIIIKK